MAQDGMDEDLSLIDQEGAMRQWLLEIDDRIDDVKDMIARSDIDWNAFIENYDISWIYHENGLEGVVLSYPEIKSAVDRKIVSDVSLLPTYDDIKAQKACVDELREKAKNRRFHVSLNYVKEMHGRLVRDEDLEGVYRKDIPIHRTYFHEIAQPNKIEAGLLKVLDFMKTKPNKELHPVELAARAHHRFYAGVPFSEYSGIIGRALMNFMLMRHGYLPAVIHTADRQRYYEALRGPEKDFRRFLANAMENSMENAMKFVSYLREREQRAAG